MPLQHDANQILFKIKKYFAITVLLVIACLFYLSNAFDGFLSAAGLFITLLSSALFLTTRAVNALSFHAIAHLKGQPPSIWQLFLIDLSASLANYLPLKPGLFAKALYLKSQFQIRIRKTVTCNFLVSFFQLYWSSTLALLAVCISISDWTALRISAISFLIATVAFAFLAGIRMAAIQTRRQHYLNWFSFQALTSALQHLGTKLSFHNMITQSTFAVILGLLVSLRLYVSFIFIETAIPFVEAILLAMIAAPARFIAILPGGLGAREALIVLGGSIAGIAPETSFEAAALDRLIQFATLALAGSLSSIKLGIPLLRTP